MSTFVILCVICESTVRAGKIDELRTASILTGYGLHMRRRKAILRPRIDNVKYPNIHAQMYTCVELMTYGQVINN